MFMTYLWIYAKRSFLFVWFIFILVDAQVDEYTMKAVAIKKLSRYIEWPGDTSIRKTESVFTILILGKDPFDGTLEKIYRHKTIKNRLVIIRHASSSKDADISACDILYLSASVASKLDPIIKRLNGKPVLLMGETAGYAERGVHIRVYIENNRIKFDINRQEATRCGIQISSKVLNLARIVSSK
jgi:hypothetical protein